MKTYFSDGKINRVAKTLDNDKAHGEYIGMMRISSNDQARYAQKLENLIQSGDVKRHYEYALDQILAEINLESLSTDGLEWTEVDTEEDYQRAKALSCANLESLTK